MVVKQPKPVLARLDPESVVRRLHWSRIRIGLQTSDEGLTVWISDRLHKVRAGHVFTQATQRGDCHARA